MASESLDQCLELWHGGGSLAHCQALVSGSISHPRASVFPSSLREGVMVVCSRTGVWVLECFCALVLQGEFRVAERKVTMKELKRALEEGRVREVFGSGTACQVCPVHQILYEGKVRQSCRGGWERKKEVPHPHGCLSLATPHSYHGKWAGTHPALPEGVEGYSGKLMNLGPTTD